MGADRQTPPGQPGPLCALVEQAALLVLLALIPVRALIAETPTFEVPRWLRSLPAPLQAQPASTLFIVALIAGVAVVVFCTRLWHGGRWYRRTGGEIGALLLLVAAAVSTWRAGQNHLALTGALDFLGMVLYLLTLRQLLTRRWHLRLAMAVILGTGSMMVTKCAYQHWVELPDTIEYYEEHKGELVGGGPGGGDGSQAAGFLHDYEQRLRSRLVTGYFAHSNVLGSYLILMVMAGLAVASGRFGRRPGWTFVLPLLISAAGVAALVGAQSKGALVALAVALLVWASSEWAMARRRRSSSRDSHSALRKRLWIVLWVGVFLGAGAVVGVLKTNPQILGRSMLFRSMYWQGAWDMLQDQGPGGVGANNFGRLFTRYKSVECPEEVESPHSWVVRATTEWGLLGLAGLLVLFVGVSRRIGRSEAQEDCGLRNADCGLGDADSGARGAAGGAEIGAAAARAGSIVLWTAGVGAVVLGWLAWLLVGSGPGYVAICILVAAVPWVIGFSVSSIESARSTEFLDDETTPMLSAICAGLIGFLLHTGIDLAMFRPGAATTFFAMMAIALAVKDCAARPEDLRPATSRTRPTPAERAGTTGGFLHRGTCVTLAATGMIGILLMVVFLVVPAARLAGHLQVARLNTQPSSWEQYTRSPQYRAYVEATGCYSLDGTAIEELADQLTPRTESVAQVDSVIERVEEFQRRDPTNAIAWHHLATLHYRRFMLGAGPADLERSIACLRSAVAAYPTAPTKRLMLANLLKELSGVTGDQATRESAARELQSTLDLDARRIYVSKPHRFTDRMREEVEARIKRLRGGPTTMSGETTSSASDQ